MLPNKGAKLKVDRLQHDALSLLLLRGVFVDKHTSDGFVEHLLEAFLREGGTFKVFESAEFVGEVLVLLFADWLPVLLAEAVHGVAVVTEIGLGADENEGDSAGVVLDFWVPLLLDVLEGRRADDGEANQEHVRLRVRQRPQAIVVFLSGSIPQAEVNRTAVNHDVSGVVVENGRNVLAREGVGGVTDEKTRLTDGPVTDDDAFDVLHSGCVCACAVALLGSWWKGRCL